MFKDVKISRFDTCLTYSLKRLGLDFLIDLGLKSIDNLEEYFELKKIDDILPGDIVVWNKKQRKIRVPQEITSDGIIIKKSVTINYHLAVVEKNNFITDVTRKLYDSGIPSIRRRDLSEVRYPDFKLVLKIKPTL